MFRQLRVEVVVPVNSKPSTATHNGRGGLQDYFPDDVATLSIIVGIIVMR
jgi:hypothetical protein